jgi:hypothetical protein
VSTVEVDAVAGQDAAPAHLPAGHAFPQAIKTLPTPNNNTKANDSAIEEENLFKLHSLKKVLRFSVFRSRPRVFMAIAQT